MSVQQVTVRTPATTANLGPGFDCLALSLDLWNETVFTLDGQGLAVSVSGEGQGTLYEDDRNLVARAALDFFRQAGAKTPAGLKITCRNAIPIGSGLGSSAAAVLAGLLGANALLGRPAGQDEILRMAVEIEGHPDNAAAGLLGGLVVVLREEQGFLTRGFELPSLAATVVLPEFDLPTQAARAVLPRMVLLADAVFNLGRTTLVVEALRCGDLDLLGKVMKDRLHQPYRLELIPGAKEALEAARRAGAAAAALSGAGPSLVAFGGSQERVAQAISDVFKEKGLPSRTFLLKTTNLAAKVS